MLQKLWLPGEIISGGAIARVASVTAVALVMFGAGVVVVPVSEANAQAEFRYTGYTVNGAKTASTSLMLDVREAPFEMDDRVFGLVFDAYSDPSESEHELMVTVNSRSTATEGKDFILPAATLRGHGTGFARNYSIDIPSDMIDEINGAVNQSTGAVTGEVHIFNIAVC